MYRIMIIEDNEKIRNELCDFLGKNGSSCGWSFYLSGGAQKQ